MPDLAILAIEENESVASWLPPEGKKHGLELIAAPTVHHLLPDLRRGRFEIIAGALELGGPALDKIPPYARPKRIPVFFPEESAESRRERWRLLLRAIAAGNNRGHGTLPSISRGGGVHSRVLGALLPAIRVLGRHDRELQSHSRRVARYATRVGKVLGVGSRDLSLLGLGGWIHDVGKVRISPDTLNKPGALRPDEWRKMHRHPLWGEDLVRPHAEGEGILRIVRHHHERFDGGGYPDKISGEKISPLARILALADAYDAMTHDRPYRKGTSHRTAIREMIAASGTQFDPVVVKASLAARLDREQG